MPPPVVEAGFELLTQLLHGLGASARLGLRALPCWLVESGMGVQQAFADLLSRRGCQGDACLLIVCERAICEVLGGVHGWLRLIITGRAAIGKQLLQQGCRALSASSVAMPWAAGDSTQPNILCNRVQRGPQQQQCDGR